MSSPSCPPRRCCEWPGEESRRGRWLPGGPTGGRAEPAGPGACPCPAGTSRSAGPPPWCVRPGLFPEVRLQVPELDPAGCVGWGGLSRERDGRPLTALCGRAPSVSRLWRESVRRVLRAQRRVAWISAGSADAGHPQEHCLVRVAAQELEASGKRCGAQAFAGLVGQSLRAKSFSNPNFAHGFIFV